MVFGTDTNVASDAVEWGMAACVITRANSMGSPKHPRAQPRMVAALAVWKQHKESWLPPSA
jgi:hypothetical protein